LEAFSNIKNKYYTQRWGVLSNYVGSAIKYFGVQILKSKMEHTP